jgi:hypothetical protein
MTQEEILTNLCCYDSRNPNRLFNEEDFKPKCCYCDNCFYGRTQLAEYILTIKTKNNGNN